MSTPAITPLAFPQGQTPTTPQAITVTMEGNTLGAEYRTFSSGSQGYYATGKVYIGGKKFQVSCSVVLVGSKPTVKPTVKPAK